MKNIQSINDVPIFGAYESLESNVNITIDWSYKTHIINLSSNPNILKSINIENIESNDKSVHEFIFMLGSTIPMNIIDLIYDSASSSIKFPVIGEYMKTNGITRVSIKLDGYNRPKILIDYPTLNYGSLFNYSNPWIDITIPGLDYYPKLGWVGNRLILALYGVISSGAETPSTFGGSNFPFMPPGLQPIDLVSANMDTTYMYNIHASKIVKSHSSMASNKLNWDNAEDILGLRLLLPDLTVAQLLNYHGEEDVFRGLGYYYDGKLVSLLISGELSFDNDLEHCYLYTELNNPLFLLQS